MAFNVTERYLATLPERARLCILDQRKELVKLKADLAFTEKSLRDMAAENRNLKMALAEKESR